MESQRRIADTYFLSPQIVGVIEQYAWKAGVSNSVAVEQIITQCSKMMVTRVVEEVTEKDVFDDINREIKAINDNLKLIRMDISEILNEVF